MKDNMIGLSFDLDWQDGKVLQSVIDLLGKYHILATFFCTHRTKVKIPQEHEMALHPNFLKDLSYRQNLSNLKKIYPQAKGVRSHALFNNYAIMETIQKFGFQYTSNYFMYLKDGIEPSTFSGLKELPIYYMDYHHLSCQKNPSFNLKNLKVITPGLKIFDIHPLNIYLNSHTFRLYQQCKNNGFKNPEKFINQSGPGLRTLFVDLLEYLDKMGISDVRLCRICGGNK